MAELSMYEDGTDDSDMASFGECDYDCHTESDHNCYDD